MVKSKRNPPCPAASFLGVKSPGRVGRRWAPWLWFSGKGRQDRRVCELGREKGRKGGKGVLAEDSLLSSASG